MTKNGFTLVELSIVIVIIGLIVAGVVGGQTLVKQAKIKAQVTDLSKYDLAYNAFKLEYDAIPGDFIDAPSHWPGVPAGDGDGRITHDPDAPHDITRENIKFFQHLSEAELIQGDYSNVWERDVGYPSLKINPNKGMVAGGNIRSAGGPGNHQVTSEDSLKPYTAVLFMNEGQNTVGSTHNSLPTGHARTYRLIDQKMDDGIARQGRFMAYRFYEPGFGNCLTSIGGDYDLTNPDEACMGMYIIEK